MISSFFLHSPDKVVVVVVAVKVLSLLALLPDAKKDMREADRSKMNLRWPVDRFI